MSEINEKVVARMTELAPLDFAKAELIAGEFGIKSKAVVASAIRRGIAYNKKAKVNKAGLPVVSKEDLVETIADKLNLTLESLDGLEKASKSALLAIANALPLPEETETETEGSEI